MEIDFEVYFCLVKKILFIIIVVMCLKPILPVVEYVVNYEYISKVLCVNKAKPMMHCDGKCHLKKELANASDNENPISDKKITVHAFEILFFQEINTFQFTSNFKNNPSELNAKYANLYFRLKGDSVFHPPSSIS